MNNIKHLVYVVMPCYNEEKSIRKSIDSILHQTYTNIELIIIDDCSSDASGSIIKEYTDERIMYYRNEHNLGVAKSLNKGIHLANGSFIARMDADDTSEPDRIEKEIEYLQNHPECVVCGSYADVDDGSIISIQGNNDSPQKYIVKGNPFVHSTVMFPKIINGKELQYSEIKGFEDYDLWIRLYHQGDFHVIPEVLVHRVDINNHDTKRLGFKSFFS